MLAVSSETFVLSEFGLRSKIQSPLMPAFVAVMLFCYLLQISNERLQIKSDMRTLNESGKRIQEIN